MADNEIKALYQQIFELVKNGGDVEIINKLAAEIVKKEQSKA